MKTYRIASIPADGIGPEVISAGLEVLDALATRDGGFKLEVDNYDWGCLFPHARGIHAGGGTGNAEEGRCNLFRRGRCGRYPRPYFALGFAPTDLPRL